MFAAELCFSRRKTIMQAVNRKISLSLGAQQNAMIHRHGFKAAVSLMIGESVGGLWQVCNCGFGRELMAPFRRCFVDDLPGQIAMREKWSETGEKQLSFTVCEVGTDFGFEIDCELQRSLSSVVQGAISQEARSEFSVALESFVRRNQ